MFLKKYILFKDNLILKNWFDKFNKLNKFKWITLSIIFKSLFCILNFMFHLLSPFKLFLKFIIFKLILIIWYYTLLKNKEFKGTVAEYPSTILLILETDNWVHQLIGVWQFFSYDWEFQTLLSELHNSKYISPEIISTINKNSYG